MSRIGNKFVAIPDGVTVSVTDQLVSVTGPRGTLTRTLVRNLDVHIEDGKLNVTPKKDLATRQTKALHGLYRQLLFNMITGVTNGFTKGLEMKGTGYRAEVQGADLVLSVGFSHPVRITAPDGVTFKVEKNVQITVEGSDKEAVGEIAAKIRSVRKPEPYKGKGIRYAGEYIRLKPGKAAKAAA